MVAYIIKVRKPNKICRFGTTGAVLLIVKKGELSSDRVSFKIPNGSLSK